LGRLAPGRRGIGVAIGKRFIRTSLSVWIIATPPYYRRIVIFLATARTCAATRRTFSIFRYATKAGWHGRLSVTLTWSGGEIRRWEVVVGGAGRG
jgi:hypothetical protein